MDYDRFQVFCIDFYDRSEDELVSIYFDLITYAIQILFSTSLVLFVTKAHTDT